MAQPASYDLNGNPLDSSGNPITPDPYEQPVASPAAPPPTAAAPPPPAATTTYTHAGYLGNQQVFQGSDGKYYQADQYNPDGSAKSYAEISGFNPGHINPSPNAGGGGAGRGSGGDSGFGIDPSWLTPFTDTFAAAPLPRFQGGTPYRPTTADDVVADPSYQFRRDQGAGQLLNNRSASGVLNSSNTLKDFVRYNSQFASNEYQNVDARRFNQWDTGFNHDLSSFQTNYQSAQADRNQAWQQFLTGRDNFFANQDKPFNKMLSVAQLGSSNA